jgi:hypothetical protein
VVIKKAIKNAIQNTIQSQLQIQTVSVTQITAIAILKALGITGKTAVLILLFL